VKPTPLLEQRLLDFVAGARYQPLKHHELARALQLRGEERPAFRHLLRRLEKEGRLVCLRKNRWSLPAAGRFVQARLSVLPGGGAIATAVDAPGREYFIGRDALAGAIHGDLAQLAPSGRRRRRPGALTEREEARVVRVIERGSRKVVGTLQRTRYYWYAIPDNPRIGQNVQVREARPGLKLTEHHKVVVQIDDWEGPLVALRGEMVEDLGPADAAGVDLLALMRDHQLDARFDEDLLQEARARSPALSGDDLAGREDLRGLLTLTIDPADARDFDDAVSLVRRADGHWEVGVHIADVAHFVTAGSPIDREAYRRGNSVYLVGGFVPMLPQHLTSDVCSLRPHVDRLTHSVLLVVDGRGRVLESRTASSVIHSAARLDYDQVQRYFDTRDADGIPPTVLPVLHDLRDLTGIIRRRRMAGGSIDLSMPEVKCVLDEQQRPIELKRRGAPEAYHLIEELMLLANVAVAERLAQRRVPALYRIHEAPSEDQWAKMATDLRALGLDHHPEDRDQINELCREVAGSPLEYSANLAVLRNLKRALYSDARVEHFGLGFSTYTHFTSPIRRYPDLVVHRLLRALETGTRMPYTHEDVRAIARHCCETERNADAAEEESLTLKRIEFYARRLELGETGPYAGLITSVIARGLIVELVESLQRGLVPLAQLPDDFYEADPERGLVRGRHHRRILRVGQTVNVELARVDEARRMVDFRLLEDEGRTTPERPRKRAGRRARQRMR
jgi:ribonuclease R